MNAVRSLARTAGPLRGLLVFVAIAPWGPSELSGATVEGRVLFRGEVPAAETVAITQDTAVCGESAERSTVVVDGEGGLAWAVVELSGGGTPSPDRPTELVQRGCAFAPRVVVTAPGTELGVLNDDGILHNVHTYSEENAVVNLAQPGFVKRLPLTFDRSERVRVTCDVHSWMEGWIVVSENAATAVTDGSGAFAFRDVPAGTHRVTVWHPAVGEQTRELVVEEGGAAQLTIELGS